MKDHILHVEKSLSVEECNNLISIFENPNIPKITGPKNDFCTKRNIHYYEAINIDITQSICLNPLLAGLEQYRKEHHFLSQVSRWGVAKFANLQKYLPLKYYSKEHCEQNYDNSSRILAFMFYLNDISVGGGTRFPQQDITLIPRAGDLYIWPASFTHSHHGLPAEKDLKYIITGWCNLAPPSKK